MTPVFQYLIRSGTDEDGMTYALTHSQQFSAEDFATLYNSAIILTERLGQAPSVADVVVRLCQMGFSILAQCNTIFAHSAVVSIINTQATAVSRVKFSDSRQEYSFPCGDQTVTCRGVFYVI